MFTDLIQQAQDSIYAYKQILAVAVNKHARKLAEEEIEKNLEVIIKYEALERSLPKKLPDFINCIHSIYAEDCPQCTQTEPTLVIYSEC